MSSKKKQCVHITRDKATPLSIVRQSPTPDTPKEYSKVLSIRVELCALCSGVLAGELGRLMRSGLL